MDNVPCHSICPVAGALVRSSDEFGLGVNAVSEKREDVATICQVVGERHFEGLNKDQKAKGLGLELRDRVGARPIDRTRVGRRVPGSGPCEALNQGC